MTDSTGPAIPAQIATQNVGIWSETNPERRRTPIEQAFAAQASYPDPVMQATGHDCLDAMVCAAQAQFSGLHFHVRAIQKPQSQLLCAAAQPGAAHADL